MPNRGSLQLAGALALAMAAPVAAQDIAADTVVATVGTTEITLGHMIAMSQNLSEEQRSLPPEVIFEGVLERLIQQEAVGQTRAGVSRLGEYYLENARRSLLAREAITDIAETIAVSPGEIESAYQALYLETDPPQEFNASHILLESEADARDVLGELEAGADFPELARERSTGPSGPNGGSLGWFGRGQMVPEFESAVADLDKGQISDPVQTQFGWHIIILNDVRDASVPAFDEVREQLRQELWQRNLTAEIQAIVEAAQKDVRNLTGIDPNVLGDGNLVDR